MKDLVTPEEVIKFLEGIKPEEEYLVVRICEYANAKAGSIMDYCKVVEQRTSEIELRIARVINVLTGVDR